MKIKLTGFCLFAVSVLFLSPAFAAERVVDNAGLLGSAEKKNLEDSAEQIALRYNFDLVIVTEETIDSSSMEYADDFFDYNGYGIGEERDGCLFLHVTGSRDYWFSTSGRGIEMLNPAAFGKLEKDVVNFLRNGDNAGAYLSFINDWEEFLALDAKGRRYNLFHRWNLVFTAAAWIIAFLTGLIIVNSWKAGMNTALLGTQANAYAVPDSLVFNERKDVFLFSTFTKTRRQTQSGSGGGRSHTASSGRSHGGGGGRY